MHVTRFRFWLLAVLLFIYLTGILILSAVTLNDPKGSNIRTFDNRNQQYYQKIKSLEYGIVSGIRPQLRPRTKIQWCTDVNFLNPPNVPVALASFPGSGNTWLRYLLQQATGIHTGSVYKDYGLLKNGFPAENIKNGSVLVVKTHEWGHEARKPFKKAILLVREPSLAIQAEFNRQSGGHIGFASPDRYKRHKDWQQFVDDKLDAWKQTNLDWLYNFTGPTHVIFYEELINKLENTLKSVIEFLQINVNYSLFKCAIERREGIYRRKRRVLNFDPFTKSMKKKIDSVQKNVYEAIYNYALPSINRRRKK